MTDYQRKRAEEPNSSAATKSVNANSVENEEKLTKKAKTPGPKKLSLRNKDLEAVQNLTRQHTEGYVSSNRRNPRFFR